MSRQLKTAILFLAAVVSACASTAGKESFERGAALERSARLEDAASMYEEAAARESGNEVYVESLRRVRGSLVAQYVATAKQLLESREQTFEQMKGARNAIDKALKIQGNHADAVEMSGKVSARMDEMTKKAEALYGEASRAAESADWVSASRKLKEVKAFYPDYLDLSLKLPQIESDGLSWYLREADRMKGMDDLDSAVRMLTQALELQPDNQQVTAVLNEMKSLNTAAGFTARAEEAAKAGNWEGAIDHLQRARAMEPDAATAARLEKLQLEAMNLYHEQAMQALQAKKLYRCYTALNMIRAAKPDFLKDQKMVELYSALSAAMTEKAEGYEQASLLGNALVWYEKALKLSPGNKDISQKAHALREKIRQRVIKKLAIMDFSSPSNNADAGRIVTDTLLAYMTKNTSADIKILARDVLGALLKEIELGQAGLYDIESAKKAGKLKGTDVFIFGSVLQHQIEKNVDEGMKRVNTVVGKRTVSNPAFDAWTRLHPSPSEKELAAAPPQSLEEEIRETISYKVATHRKTANVSVSFRVIDVEEGEVVITKTLKKSKEAKDTYQEGVEFANIAYKELQLPSDTELFEQVVDSIIEELAREVLSRFQNLQLTYFNTAEKLRKHEEPERALEKYVDAVHVEEVKNVSTQVSENSRREIEQILKAVSN